MKQQSEVKGFTVLSAASIINKLLGILYVPVLTIIIGNVGNGIYDAGFKIYQLVFVITNSGIPIALSKLISEQIASERYDVSHNTLKISAALMISIGTLTSLLTAVFAKQISIMVDFPESYLVILALSPTMLFTAASCVFRGYFQGRSNMIPTGISQVIEQAVNSVLTIIFAWLMYRYGMKYAISIGITEAAEINLEAVKFAAAGGTVGTSLGALASALYLYWTYLKNKAGILAEAARSAERKQTPYTAKTILRKIFEYSVPITIGSVAIYLTGIIDLKFTKSRLLAAGFSIIEANAHYGILATQYTKVLFIPVTLATALAATIIPSVSAASAKGDELLLGRRISKSIKTILMISVPSAIGIAILAKPVIHILFPTAPDGWDLLIMGSWILVLISLVSVQTAILQGIGKTYIPTIHLVIGLILKIIINYNLISIKSVNIKGALVGSAVCYIFAAFMNHRAVKKLTGVRLDVKRLFNRPLSVSIIMGILVLFIYHGLTLMTEWLIKSLLLRELFCTSIAIAAGCMVYYLLMIVAGGITAEEIKSLPAGGRILDFTIKIPYMKRYLAKQ